ncbi:MAG: arsenate reductase (glutaredoxin) [Planctomycetota bacterium]
MQPTLQLLHNPDCSKSRAALAWLTERGLPFEVRNYLEDPLDGPELDRLRAGLDAPWQEWVRGEDLVARIEQLPGDQRWPALRQGLLEQPANLQRPIVVAGDRAVVARPLERLADWLAVD